MGGKRSRGRSLAGSSPENTAERERGDADAPSDRRRGLVEYRAGPDGETLGARYGIDVAAGEVRRLQQLESEFGRERVQRWAAEGIPVERMGKPRDMRAFRQQQADSPDAVSTDIEEPNAASRRHSAARKRDESAAVQARAKGAIRKVVSSPGRSLDGSVQREMEAKMGGEFGDVRVHTGPNASTAAESVNARALTVGNHLAFNDGEYQPGTDEGKKLIAHELVHVRQQTSGRVSLLPDSEVDRLEEGLTTGGGHVQPDLEVSSPDDPAEREAERVAEQVMRMDSEAPQSAAVTAFDADRASQADPLRQETSRPVSVGAQDADEQEPRPGSGTGSVSSPVVGPYRLSNTDRQVQRQSGEVLEIWEGETDDESEEGGGTLSLQVNHRHGSYDVEITDSECIVTVKIDLEPENEDAREQLAQVREDTRREVKRYWDGTFEFEDAKGNVRTLRVEPEFGADDPHFEVDLEEGSGRANITKWHVEDVPDTLAHEVGHQLGISDEYVAPTDSSRDELSDADVKHDISLMGSHHTVDNPDVRLRHGELIAEDISRYAPGFEFVNVDRSDTYTVVGGEKDTLKRLAERFYWTEDAWRALAEENADLLDDTEHIENEGLADDEEYLSAGTTLSLPADEDVYPDTDILGAVIESLSDDLRDVVEKGAHKTVRSKVKQQLEGEVKDVDEETLEEAIRREVLDQVQDRDIQHWVRKVEIDAEDVWPIIEETVANTLDEYEFEETVREQTDAAAERLLQERFDDMPAEINVDFSSGDPKSGQGLVSKMRERLLEETE